MQEVIHSKIWDQEDEWEPATPEDVVRCDECGIKHAIPFQIGRAAFGSKVCGYCIGRYLQSLRAGRCKLRARRIGDDDKEVPSPARKEPFDANRCSARN